MGRILVFESNFTREVPHPDSAPDSASTGEVDSHVTAPLTTSQNFAKETDSTPDTHTSPLDEFLDSLVEELEREKAERKRWLNSSEETTKVSPDPTPAHTREEGKATEIYRSVTYFHYWNYIFKMDRFLPNAGCSRYLAS